jgi:O-antigen ligase
VSVRDATTQPVFEADRLFEQLALFLFVGILAWAPFPLGSNRPWAWSLLALLVTGVWVLWYCSVWSKPNTVIHLSHRLAGPVVLALLALGWGIVQGIPVIPANGTHPIWRVAAGIIGKASPTISVSPWTTETEVMKLAIYVMAVWLARAFASNAKRAAQLIDAVIFIGAFYAIYGFALVLAGQSQFQIFYEMPLGQTADLSGPFVNRNNFATYEGLVALCATGRLVSGAWMEAGVGSQWLSVPRYIFGRGALWLASALLAFAIVLSTGSRGGNLATWIGAIALFIFGLHTTARLKRGWLVVALVSAALAVAIALFEMSGGTLLSRLNEMAANGTSETTRRLLWNDAIAMIHAEPFTGWGLGSYQIVYPLFSKVSMPFIMDKAHNDYLELTAGWGLPATLAWWGAFVWLVVICWRGFLHRRHDRVYPALAVAATILVAIHSLFDFSLQMPAISLTYATILGAGVAQAFRSHHPTAQGSTR